MFKQNSITSTPGARRSSKRLGRGDASGKGSFSGRGCKGQLARTGKKIHPLFEGGQSPMHLRLPKSRGFKALSKTAYFPLNLDIVETLALAGIKKIDKAVLVEKGILTKSSARLKLLADGKLTQACEIHVDAASASAIAQVEKAGGKLVIPESGAPKESR